MADFYAARDNTTPPLPWPSIAPPFTVEFHIRACRIPNGLNGEICAKFRVDLSAASFWNASIAAKAVHLSKDELSHFSEKEKLRFKDPESFKLIMADVTLEEVFGLLPLRGRIEFLDDPNDAALIDRTRNAELNIERFQEFCGVNFIDTSKTKQLC